MAAVDRKPRTLWACQSVAFLISVRVAPLPRPISARIFAPLLSARRVVTLSRADLAAFLPDLAAFFGAAFVLPPLAPSPPLARALLLAGPFLRGGLLRRHGRALFPHRGGWVGFCVGHVDVLPILSVPGWRMTIHHSVPRERQGKNERLSPRFVPRRTQGDP